jgi:aryl-alcohol dehydrogenase-like predicted oxidoreductase
MSYKANVYSNGVSEELVGKAIKKYNLPREKLVILTKCFGYVGEDPGLRTITYAKEMPQLKDYVNQGGLSRQAIFNAVNASLKRLDLEYIDLLQIHRYDPNTPLEETMEALHDLVKSGKVRYIGASSMWAVQFAQLQFTAEKNGWTKFISMQNHYNLLYREEEREMIRFCNDTGVGLIPVCIIFKNKVSTLLIGDSGHRFAVAISLALPPLLAQPLGQKANRKLAIRRLVTLSVTRRSLVALKRSQRSTTGR